MRKGGKVIKGLATVRKYRGSDVLRCAKHGGRKVEIAQNTRVGREVKDWGPEQTTGHLGLGRNQQKKGWLRPPGDKRGDEGEITKRLLKTATRQSQKRNPERKSNGRSGGTGGHCSGGQKCNGALYPTNQSAGGERPGVTKQGIRSNEKNQVDRGREGETVTLHIRL